MRRGLNQSNILFKFHFKIHRPSSITISRTNMLKLISNTKRGEGRAEMLERKRREYLVRKSHNRNFQAIPYFIIKLTRL